MIKKHPKLIAALFVLAVTIVWQFGIASNTAHAAITFVGSTTQQVTTGMSYTVDLTSLTGGSDSAPLEGDIVIVAAINASTTDAEMSADGFTEIVDLYSDDTRDTNLYVGYKIMGATPDTSITVPGGGTSIQSVANVQVWRGVDQVNPLDAAATSTSAINGLVANPPVATPATPGAVFALVYGSSGSPARIPPATVDYAMGAAGTGATVILGMAALYTHSLDSYDPPAWSNAFSNSGDTWHGVTIPLRPATPLPGYYADIGTAVGVANTTATVDWPTHQVGDIGILVVESQSNEPTLTNSVGFTKLGPTVLSSLAGATRLDVFWARATSSSMASPVLSATGDHKYASILTFRGIPTNNVPYVSFETAVATSTQTNQYIPAATSTAENQLMLMIAATGADTTAGSFGSTFTNTSIRWIYERNDAGTNQSGGGGFLAITSLTKTAGSTELTQVTGPASATAMMTIVFNSVISEGTVAPIRSFTKFLNSRMRINGGRILFK